MKKRSYPARVKWSHRSVADVDAGTVAVRGRLLQLDRARGCGKLVDQTGELKFNIDPQCTEILAGDIVELSGVVAAGILTVCEYHLLSPGGEEWASGDWARFNLPPSKLRENLVLRAGVMNAVHQFFSAQAFLPVETPIITRGSAQEEHIQLFATEYRVGKTKERVYLAPSPELYMKRMLGIGFERIFQITRSFRNGEVGPQHNPEFALLEWYRAYASYAEVMVDVENLVAYVAEKVTGHQSVIRDGVVVELAPPWQRISVHQAFARWADIDLGVCNDVQSLYRRANELGYDSASPEDNWEDLFHKILLEKVEPQLARLGAVHLVDYPWQLAALAKFKEGEPSIAERTEAYVGGVELSNGYTELNDPEEQHRRFCQGGRGQKPEDAIPDEAFLQAMERGFPPAGGVALGLDRLVMLVAGASKLDEVIAFPAGY